MSNLHILEKRPVCGNILFWCLPESKSKIEISRHLTRHSKSKKEYWAGSGINDTQTFISFIDFK